MIQRDREREASVVESGVNPARARAVVRDVVRRSGSSFRSAMLLLPTPKREAIHAVYAFCRWVDDIADADLDPDEKLRALETWRREIDRLFRGNPRHPIAVALLEPVERFALPKAEFAAVVEGMMWDAAVPICAPPLEALQRYCRLVAGAAGMLSIHIFEARSEGAVIFAIELGEALQLTNILRDIAEDAERGRLYIPGEFLAQHGIHARQPLEIVKHPQLPDACRALERLARERFEGARAALAGCDRFALRPALAMMGVYLCLLDSLAARGWPSTDNAAAPPRSLALIAAARAALLGPLWPRSI